MAVEFGSDGEDKDLIGDEIGSENIDGEDADLTGDEKIGKELTVWEKAQQRHTALLQPRIKRFQPTAHRQSPTKRRQRRCK